MSMNFSQKYNLDKEVLGYITHDPIDFETLHCMFCHEGEWPKYSKVAINAAVWRLVRQNVVEIVDNLQIKLRSPDVNT